MITNNKLIPRADLLMPRHSLLIEKDAITATDILNPDCRVVKNEPGMEARDIGVIEHHRAFRVSPLR